MQRTTQHTQPLCDRHRLRGMFDTFRPLQRRLSGKFSHIKARVDSGLRRKPPKSYKSHSCIDLSRPVPPSSIIPGLRVHSQTSRPCTSIVRPSTATTTRPQRPATTITVTRVHPHIAALTEARQEIRELEEIIATQQLLLKEMKGKLEVRGDSNSSNGHFKPSSVKLTGSLESLTKELKEERSENAKLRREVMTGKLTGQKIEQMNRRVSELEEENTILKNSLDKCMRSCFSEIKNPNHPSREVISQLSSKHLQVIEAQQQQIQLLQQKLTVIDSEKRTLEGRFQNLSITIDELHDENERLKTQIEKLATVSISKEYPTKNPFEQHHHHQASSSSVKVEQMQEALREIAEMKNLLEQFQESIKEGEDDLEE